MEVNASGKHTSLLRYGNNYCRKKFYSTGPRMNRQNQGDRVTLDTQKYGITLKKDFFLTEKQDCRQ